MEKKTIFVVGVGYVGEMLCHQLSLRDDVERIVALDKDPQTDWCKTFDKVTYIQGNMADEDWVDQVAAYEPDVVIHTAWQIRSMYGQTAEQWRWNVDGSEAVFDFAFNAPSVKKLIYFSTAASYSARVDNTFAHEFTESEGFRDDSYLYAHEKKVSEERLEAFYKNAKELNLPHIPQVTILRPAAITGPRGRFGRIRFGLQSALSGNLPGGFLNKIVTILTSFLPATHTWVRQFVHEDDVVDAVQQFSFEPHAWEYQAFNLTPDTEIVYAKDMANAVGKRALYLPVWLIRIGFFVCWHLTRGKIPTGPGVWRFYSYPIVMSGKKLAAVYDCKYSCIDAITYTDGLYEEQVPAEQKSSKSAG